MPAAKRRDHVRCNLTAIGRKVSAGSHAALVSTAPAIICCSAYDPLPPPENIHSCACHLSLNSIRSKTSGIIARQQNCDTVFDGLTTTIVDKA